MVEFLENNENIIREELMTYYQFRASLIKHVNDRIDLLQKTKNSSEYDYCTQEGQIKELQSLLVAIRNYGRHTVITKQIESTELKELKELKKN